MIKACSHTKGTIVARADGDSVRIAIGSQGTSRMLYIVPGAGRTLFWKEAPGDDAKSRVLKAIAARIAPGAPLILAGNRYAYASKPLVLAAWGERWRMHGATNEEVKAKLA